MLFALARSLNHSRPPSSPIVPDHRSRIVSILQYVRGSVRGGCEVLSLENDSSPAIFFVGGGLSDLGDGYWLRADGVEAMEADTSSGLPLLQ